MRNVFGPISDHDRLGVIPQISGKAPDHLVARYGRAPKNRQYVLDHPLHWLVAW
jgi:hypothetical protein